MQSVHSIKHSGKLGTEQVSSFFADCESKSEFVSNVFYPMLNTDKFIHQLLTSQHKRIFYS
jgi:hypothetical protein